MDIYPWIVVGHVFLVIVAFGAHGYSAFAMLGVKRETDRERTAVLLSLSSTALLVAGIGLLIARRVPPDVLADIPLRRARMILGSDSVFARGTSFVALSQTAAWDAFMRVSTSRPTRALPNCRREK
jgi:hypothetical protein